VETGVSLRRGRKVGLPRFDGFLGWLVEDQEGRGESDTAYAKRRGLSRSQYANAKAGRRGLSRALVERICQRDAAARCAYHERCLRGPAP
jgi:hypothetical protein